jgi:hypothetical protein
MKQENDSQGRFVVHDQVNVARRDAHVGVACGPSDRLWMA